MILCLEPLGIEVEAGDVYTSTAPDDMTETPLEEGFGGSQKFMDKK
jgi:hypothetical protein